MHRARTRLNALLVGVAALQSACLQLSMEGQSSGEMKREMTRSFLFRSADLFYPAGVPADPRASASLAPAQLAEVQRQLRSTLATIEAVQTRHARGLGQLFEHPVPSQVPARLIVLDRGTPEARTLADATIDIDVRVIRATFLAAAVNAQLADVQVQRVRDGRSMTGPVTPAEEKHALQVLLDMKRTVEATPGRSALGDLLGDTDLRGAGEGGSGWFAMRDFVRVLNESAARYDAQLLFVLAHETAHLALGHFGDAPALVSDREQDAGRDEACVRRRGMERAADVYATYLLTLATPDSAMADVLGLAAGAFGQVRLFEGFDNFFRSAYDYAGFDRAVGCAYPSPEQRRAVVEASYKAVRDGQVRAILEGARRQ